MEATTTGVAAALAILQAYPLGTLKVETPYGPGRLTGLRFDASHGCVVGDVQDITLVLGGAVCALEALTPHLRPFAALTQKLPDGTVPAIEVAKLLPYSHKFNWEEAKAQLYWAGHNYIEVTAAYGTHVLTLYPDDFGFSESSLTTCLRVVEYLRSKHFAVGLPETAYIPL